MRVMAKETVRDKETELETRPEIRKLSGLYIGILFTLTFFIFEESTGRTC
jgi:hypothetical protein